MNRNLKALSLLGALVVNSAFATEWRTPWISERGPLRYTFEKLHDEEGKSNLNYWSVLHAKGANKAFGNNGDTTPITTLIFNKSDFSLNQIFPNSMVPLNVENFNPFLNTVTIHPRVAYFETGATFGGRWDYPVWENKGRIGIRGTVPVRSIEIERKDFDDEILGAGLDGVFEGQVKKVTRTTNPDAESNAGPSNGSLSTATTFPDVVTQAWRFDFVQSIPNANGSSIVTFPATGGVAILGNTIAVDTSIVSPPGTPTESRVTVALTGVATGEEFPETGSFQFANFSTTPIPGILPALPGSPLSAGNEAEFPVGPQAQASDFAAIGATPVKTPVATLPANKVSYFVAGTDYSGFELNNTANNPSFIPLTPGVCPPPCAPCASTCPTVCPNPGLLSQLANAWLIFRYDAQSNETDKINKSSAVNIARIIKERSQIFTQTAGEFFEDAGIDFNTHSKTGLGDIDVDLFYEHTFSKRLIGELMFGVRFPTGAKAKYCQSPYAIQLGNNAHYEIKLGGDIAWKFARCVGFKFDTYYSFVLKKTENRMAVFQGAQIKNLGPCAKADVDWGYYVARADFTFFHPKTSNVRSMLGYEFYYKTKDKVNWKNRLQESLLGGIVGQTTPNLQALDNCLAAKWTQSMGHKLRGETSCQINDWFELFAGATYTFAGKNVYLDTDAHAGFNIRF